MSRDSAMLLPSARGPNAMLSCTDIQVKSAPCWNTTPRSEPGPVIVLPSSVARPVVGVSKPATILSSVLLPQPDGPTMVINSPAPTAMSMGLSACTASAPEPKRLDTPSITSLATVRRGAASSATGSIVIPTTLDSRLRGNDGQKSRSQVHEARAAGYTIFARNVESTYGAQLGGIVVICSADLRNSACARSVRSTPVSFAPGMPIHFSVASSFGGIEWKVLM